MLSLLLVDSEWDCEAVHVGCVLVTTTGITWSFQEYDMELAGRGGRDGKELGLDDNELLFKPLQSQSYPSVMWLSSVTQIWTGFIICNWKNFNWCNFELCWSLIVRRPSQVFQLGSHVFRRPICWVVRVGGERLERPTEKPLKWAVEHEDCTWVWYQRTKSINLQEVEVTKGGEGLNIGCEKRSKLTVFLV